MMSNGDDGVMSDAGIALARYLSDDIAPLLFVDAADNLLTSPKTAAAMVRAWIASQYQTTDPLPVADYLFHAAKKLHMLLELEVVERDPFVGFLRQLVPLLVEVCPEDERAGMIENLRHLADASAAVTSQLEIVHRPASARSPGHAGAESRQDSVRTSHQARFRGAAQSVQSGSKAEAAHAQVATEGLALGLRRLNLLLDRLDVIDTPGPKTDGNLGEQQAVVAEVIGEVAAGARSSRELEGQLALLQSVGMPVSGDSLLRVLSRSLPDWIPPVADGEGEQPSSGPLQAMRRVVGLSADGDEKMKRFSEVVVLAVEDFNGGSLGRATSLIELAQRMVDDGEIDSVVVQRVINQAFPMIDEDRLRATTENETDHPALRRLLAFFPQLEIDELLLELEVEPKRDRRRFLIALLAAYGEPARNAALKALSDSMSGERPLTWYVERNLVHLLRKISRGEDRPIQSEVEVLARASQPAGPLPLVREALAALGSLHHSDAEKVLVARLREIEEALLGRAELPHDADDLRSLLDGIGSGLGRSPSPTAHRFLAEHGIKRSSALGETSARLRHLGNHDLSGEAELVERLTSVLRDELPLKVFGMPMQTGRKVRFLEGLVSSLASTTAPAVRDLLQHIVSEFAGQPFADNAASHLTSAAPADTATAETQVADSPSLGGDLQVFGVPNLLQNLADSNLSGTLQIIDGMGQEQASVRLSEGHVTGARAGELSNETAIYQLLERPVGGRFTFTQEAGGDEKTEIRIPVMSLVLEGMRRYDELQRALAIVPDDASYRGVGDEPDPPPAEVDLTLVQDVWKSAAGGEAPLECEARLAVDCYRIRRMYEYWVTTGVLETRN